MYYVYYAGLTSVVVYDFGSYFRTNPLLPDRVYRPVAPPGISPESYARGADLMMGVVFIGIEGLRLAGVGNLDAPVESPDANAFQDW